MNMVRPWSQYVSRASPTNHLALYECVGTTPCSSMASWRCTAVPLPEDLMRRLDGTHYFSKVDFADAYNQIELGPESQRRLGLSTHRGVLLQTRLPFGISSATEHFQDVMNQLTSDLPGVAVYLDDILISGKTAEDHLNNLHRLLKRLNDRGLRCRIQKCVFAQDSVTYLGQIISRDGIDL